MRTGLLRLTALQTMMLVKGAEAPSALARARDLLPEAPTPNATTHGEFEAFEWWDTHDQLFRDAWMELGSLNPAMANFDNAFEQRFIAPAMRNAVRAAIESEGRYEDGVTGLFTQVIPGVFMTTNLFTKEFLDGMCDELDHFRSAGIPMRRPNGMNRYGCMLDDMPVRHMIRGFVGRYVTPVAQTLFPAHIGAEDTAEHYAFSVRYAQGEDLALAEHRDASVATLNVCLGKDFTGGDLEFVGEDGERHRVAFTPGMALIHLGAHRHQALPLESGERTNMIIWLHGEGGVVRVAPYSTGEQLTAESRWSSLSGRQKLLNWVPKLGFGSSAEAGGAGL